jgi:hypothetical protein
MKLMVTYEVTQNSTVSKAIENKLKSYIQSTVKRMACGHKILLRENSQTEVQLLTARMYSPPSFESWEEGIRQLFKSSEISTSSGQPYCSECGSYQSSSERVETIVELNESITFTIDRQGSQRHRSTPIVISPCLELSSYCDPELLTRPYKPDNLQLQCNQITIRLRESLPTMPTVLMDLIGDYSAPSVSCYWLQSIVLQNDALQSEYAGTTIIVRCLSSESETMQSRHVGCSNEWWYIRNKFVIPILSSDIFETNVSSHQQPDKDYKYPSPLTHAITLRYQR